MIIEIIGGEMNVSALMAFYNRIKYYAITV